MSIDSDIASYKRKIKNIEKAMPHIKMAITNYSEAMMELKKIKGVQRCEDFKSQIQKKIDSLKDLISNMNDEIERYESKIRSLRKEKEMQESASEGGGV